MVYRIRCDASRGPRRPALHLAPKLQILNRLHRVDRIDERSFGAKRVPQAIGTGIARKAHTGNFLPQHKDRLLTIGQGRPKRIEHLGGKLR